MSTDFDFNDINLDFLVSTPPKKATSSHVDSPLPKAKINVGRQNASTKKRVELAQKVACADKLMREIQNLKCDNQQLQTQLKDLQKSAIDIQNLYTSEKRSHELKAKTLQELQKKCEKLDTDLVVKSLTCDQYESQLENNKDRPIDYNEMAVKYLRLVHRLEAEESFRCYQDRSVIDELKQYCAKLKLKIYPTGASPKKLRSKSHKVQKVDATIQCELLQEKPDEVKAETKCQATQCQVELRTQGTQHISTMTTRSTTTDCFIKFRTVATNFPETSAEPPVDDILKTFAPWQNITPISPLIDLPACQTVSQETQTTFKTIGTCTFLCNIRRPIDFIPRFKTKPSQIPRSNSCDVASQSIKQELPTPSTSPTPQQITTSSTAQNLPPVNSTVNNPNISISEPLMANMAQSLNVRQTSNTSFNDLWHIFGRMVLGLLQTSNSNAGIAVIPASASTSIHQDATNQQQFQIWLRELYENSVAANNEISGTEHTNTNSVQTATDETNTTCAQGDQIEDQTTPSDANPLSFDASTVFNSTSVVRPQARRPFDSDVPTQLDEASTNLPLQPTQLHDSVNATTSSTSSLVNEIQHTNSPLITKRKNKKSNKVLEEIQKLLPEAQLSKSKQKALKRLLKKNNRKKQHVKRKHQNKPAKESFNETEEINAYEETAVDFINSLLHREQNGEYNAESSYISNLETIKQNETTPMPKDITNDSGNFTQSKNLETENFSFAKPAQKPKKAKYSNKKELYTSLFGDSDTELEESDIEETAVQSDSDNNTHNTESISGFVCPSASSSKILTVCSENTTFQNCSMQNACPSIVTNTSPLPSYSDLLADLSAESSILQNITLSDMTSLHPNSYNQYDAMQNNTICQDAFNNMENSTSGQQYHKHTNEIICQLPQTHDVDSNSDSSSSSEVELSPTETNECINNENAHFTTRMPLNSCQNAMQYTATPALSNEQFLDMELADEQLAEIQDVDSNSDSYSSAEMELTLNEQNECINNENLNFTTQMRLNSNQNYNALQTTATPALSNEQYLDMEIEDDYESTIVENAISIQTSENHLKKESYIVKTPIDYTDNINDLCTKDEDANQYLEHNSERLVIQKSSGSSLNVDQNTTPMMNSCRKIVSPIKEHFDKYSTEKSYLSNQCLSQNLEQTLNLLPQKSSSFSLNADQNTAPDINSCRNMVSPIDEQVPETTEESYDSNPCLSESSANLLPEKSSSLSLNCDQNTSSFLNSNNSMFAQIEEQVAETFSAESYVSENTSAATFLPPKSSSPSLNMVQNRAPVMNSCRNMISLIQEKVPATSTKESSISNQCLASTLLPQKSSDSSLNTDQNTFLNSSRYMASTQAEQIVKTSKEEKSSVIEISSYITAAETSRDASAPNGELTTDEEETDIQQMPAESHDLNQYLEQNSEHTPATTLLTRKSYSSSLNVIQNTALATNSYRNMISPIEEQIAAASTKESYLSNQNLSQNPAHNLAATLLPQKSSSTCFNIDQNTVPVLNSCRNMASPVAEQLAQTSTEEESSVIEISSYITDSETSRDVTTPIDELIIDEEAADNHPTSDESHEFDNNANSSNESRKTLIGCKVNNVYLTQNMDIKVPKLQCLSPAFVKKNSNATPNSTQNENSLQSEEISSTEDESSAIELSSITDVENQSNILKPNAAKSHKQYSNDEYAKRKVIVRDIRQNYAELVIDDEKWRPTTKHNVNSLQNKKENILKAELSSVINDTFIIPGDNTTSQRQSKSTDFGNSKLLIDDNNQTIADAIERQKISKDHAKSSHKTCINLKTNTKQHYQENCSSSQLVTDESLPYNDSSILKIPVKTKTSNNLEAMSESQSIDRKDDLIDSTEISSLLSTSMLKHILSDTLSPIVDDILQNANDISFKMPANDGQRKRKSRCQPEEQPACKRSERLRVKRMVLEQMPSINSSSSPIEIGKYTSGKYMRNNLKIASSTIGHIRKQENKQLDVESLQMPGALNNLKLGYFKETDVINTNYCEPLIELKKRQKIERLSLETESKDCDLKSAPQPVALYTHSLKTAADSYNIMQKSSTATIASIHPKPSVYAKAFHTNFTSNEQNFDFPKPITPQGNYMKTPCISKPAAPLSINIPSPKQNFDYSDSPLSPQNEDSTDSMFNTTFLDKPNHIPLELLPQYTPQRKQSSLLENLVHHYSPEYHKMVTHQFDNNKRKRATRNHYDKALLEYCQNPMDLDLDCMAEKLVRKLELETLDYNVLYASIICLTKTTQAFTMKEADLPSIVQEMPPRHLNLSLKRLFYLLKHLSYINGQCCGELQKKITTELFCGQVSKLSLHECLLLTQLYLITCKLQEPQMVEHPARLFLGNCLYACFVKAVPMVYEVLMWYPTTLPHREQYTYDHSDALITVIQYCLMCYKYDMENAETRGKLLLSKLRYEYHYEVFKYKHEEVALNLVEKLKCGKFQYLCHAFTIFSKRLSSQICENLLLQSHLMPLANTFYEAALNNEDYDQNIAKLLFIVSIIIRRFPIETNIDVYCDLFSRFLNGFDRKTIQEAAACAILRLQGFGNVNCLNRLRLYRPSYELEPDTQAMFKTFVHRQKISFLKHYLKQNPVNFN